MFSAKEMCLYPYTISCMLHKLKFSNSMRVSLCTQKISRSKTLPWVLKKIVFTFPHGVLTDPNIKIPKIQPCISFVFFVQPGPSLVLV